MMKEPFYAACCSGHIEIVKLIIENNDKIDCNKPTNSKATPFFIACQKGHIGILLESEKKKARSGPQKYSSFVFRVLFWGSD